MKNYELEKMGVCPLNSKELETTNGGILLGGFPWGQVLKYAFENWSDIKKGLSDGWTLENF